MKQRITPDIPRDAAARIAAEQSGDLKARWMMVDRAEECFDLGREGRRAAATLIHAERYLADREEYEREPWPKNMVQLPYIAERA